LASGAPPHCWVKCQYAPEMRVAPHVRREANRSVSVQMRETRPRGSFPEGAEKYSDSGNYRAVRQISGRELTTPPFTIGKMSLGKGLWHSRGRRHATPSADPLLSEGECATAPAGSRERGTSTLFSPHGRISRAPFAHLGGPSQRSTCAEDACVGSPRQDRGCLWRMRALRPILPEMRLRGVANALPWR
jgi:hypothetical protein